jgi:hypothetical protein
MNPYQSSATEYLAERVERDSEFTYAILADAAGVLFWIAVLASVVVAFMWLTNLIEHLDFRKGWKLAIGFAGLVALAKALRVAGAYLRTISPSYTPGEAVFSAAWIVLSMFLLIGPVVLILRTQYKKPS